MADIKKKGNIAIKKKNNKKMYAQKLKRNAIKVKSKINGQTNEPNSENTINEYGTDKIETNSKTLVNKGITNFNKYGKKSVKETKYNIEQSIK